MKKISIAWIVLFVAFGCVVVAPVEAALTPAEQLLAGLAQTRTAFAPTSSGPVSVATLGYASLAAFEAGDAAAGVVYLRKELATQAEDGTLPPAVNSARVDANATAFAVQPWGPILLRHASELDASTRNALARAARRAVATLEARTVDVGYTNIYLMRAVDVLLIGDALDDANSVDYARMQLRAWIEQTKASGIREYDSPSYFAVDFDVLGVAAELTKEADVRAALRGILDYFWRDTAAHVVGGRFAGAHSRDYDFTAGTWGLGTVLALGGFCSPNYAFSSDLSKVLAYVGRDEIARVPEDARRDSDRSHVVTSRFGSLANNSTYAFVDRSIAMGSATDDYAAEDKPFDVTFGGLENGIAFVPEGSGDPYGRGAGKPAHLRLHPSAVQERGTLLALLDVDPAEAGATANLSTSVLLPLDATIRVDGMAVDLSIDGTHPLSTHSVVSISRGLATAWIRIASANGVFGPASIALISDAAGRQAGAVRIVVTAYAGEPRSLPTGHARVAALLAVDDEGHDRGMALATSKLVQSASDALWNFAATIDGRRFSSTVDNKTRRLVRASVDESVIARPGPLEIDGKSVSLDANL